jgi:hypothetical protein
MSTICTKYTQPIFIKITLRRILFRHINSATNFIKNALLNIAKILYSLLRDTLIFIGRRQNQSLAYSSMNLYLSFLF